eukprot:CAMPEP_0202890474 /NCGR_PEP_ID=MMETSP1392-20130828/864_1 /ASSEMBLY_ACC=CAM_ASM_000868 /TAXON_ID=225041 /ORGANISM="Chlamydomonas chlamydogama, Strain SAG 11-48b" /LENGTH=83 /DNA_ID=CAMNT_0049574051 /DNA_START=141 /DNA_END=392 /DNA_ORIENTATION=+
MASMGLQGGTARCYDWYMDYLKCLDESTAPMLAMRKQECREYVEDYNECLHRDKQKLREYFVERERRRQLEAKQAGHAEKSAH